MHLHVSVSRFVKNIQDSYGAKHGTHSMVCSALLGRSIKAPNGEVVTLRRDTFIRGVLAKNEKKKRLSPGH
jgi:hypothetical protein